MELYYPPTKIEGRWRDAVIIAIGLWLSLLGAFSWWADYLLYSHPAFTNEWTVEQREKDLTRLVEKSRQEGTIEPTLEEKIRALSGK